MCLIALAEEDLDVAFHVIGPERNLEAGPHGIELSGHAIDVHGRDLERARPDETRQYVDGTQTASAAGAEVRAEGRVLLLVPGNVSKLVDMSEVGEFEGVIAGIGKATFIAISRTEYGDAIVTDAEQYAIALAIEEVEVPKSA